MKTFEDFRENVTDGFGQVFLTPAQQTPGHQLPFENESSGSKPVAPITIGQEWIKDFEARLKDEYTAHFIYKNAANWCKNANYPKAAAFFDAEAADELEHAQSLQNYLTQWNALPNIPAEMVPNKMTSLIDCINAAYEFEYGLLVSYSEMQIKMDKANPAHFNFIQKFVDIQNHSVGVFSDLLNALNLVDYNNKLDLLMFENKYF
jgi:ferritin